MLESFREWLLLTEIGHIALPRETTIPLPDSRGERQYFSVHMVDPMFEIYKPTGIRDDAQRQYNWKEIVSGKIGWEGLIPFTHNLFFGVAYRDRYATIGQSRDLIRLPDGWYAHARFIDQTGETVYFAPDHICVPVGQAVAGQRQAV